MVAGSDPVQQPVLTPLPNQTPSEDYVTAFRVEVYTPPYLQGNSQPPKNMVLSSRILATDARTFTIVLNVPAGNMVVAVALYHGGYVTHSLHMNHGMLFLDSVGCIAGATSQTLTVTMPPSNNIILIRNIIWARRQRTSWNSRSICFQRSGYVMDIFHPWPVRLDLLARHQKPACMFLDVSV